MTHGILTHREIRALLSAGAITSELPLDGVQHQPTTLDLRLGATAYELRAGFLPRSAAVGAVAEALAVRRIDLTRGAVLRRGHVHVVPLLERLALPPEISARANPRSSIGRIDVFTRLLTDRCERFDDVVAGYAGPLWLEILPRSFDLRVGLGSRLCQMRFSSGPHLLDDRALAARLRSDRLLGDGPPAGLDQGSLLLGISLIPERPGGPVAFRARSDAPLLDLLAAAPVGSGPWFQPVFAAGDGSLCLEPEAFTLLASAQRIAVPPDLCAEMLPWDTGLGELRTNYAGFFDPGFGWGPGSPRGARAVLEVRSHDVAFRVEHGQPLCRLRWSSTVAPCTRLYGENDSAYQDQGLALARFFRRD